MRAKEYLNNRQKTMYYYNEVERIVNDLYKLRLDKEATRLYYERILLSDINFEEWKREHSKWKELSQEFGSGLTEPEYIKNEWELDIENAQGIRECLLEVVENDKSFGYITYLLSTGKRDIPSHQEIENAILKDPIDELGIAKRRILELEKQLEDRNVKTSELERQIELHSSSLENEEMGNCLRNERSMKVTTDVLVKLLMKLNVFKDPTNYNTKIAELINYLTGFSLERIRRRISNKEELTNYHGKEIEKINKLLTELNIGITITYNKQG